MSLFKVIVFLLIFLTVVVDSRALRKRREEERKRSSAYYGGGNGLGLYQYMTAWLGNNYVPVGNNWYIPGPLYPYPFPPGMLPPPYASFYGYPTAYNAYGPSQYGGLGLQGHYPNNDQVYTGQSYTLPISGDWLPLPGRDRRRRRQLLESALLPNMDNNLALSKSK